MESQPAHPSRRDVLIGSVVAAGAACILGDMNVRAQPAGMTHSASGLPRATPESLGIETAGILAFIDEVNLKVGGLHSLMLLRHGKVAAEGWWQPYAPEYPHVLYSLSKSFTSTAVGLAVAEGLFTVEDKVVSFFPELLPEVVTENLAAMRVKDLLTMNTGHEKEPQVKESPDWVKTFLAAPVDHKPGTHFLYNTAGTHVLAAIVTKKTGQRMLDYLRPRLFEPLGIVGPTWDQSPKGIDIGGYGLSVKTEDIAKFGQLYLQKGNWNGKQLIPEAWVAEATSKQVPNGDPATGGDWNQGYGYQFWRCRHNIYRGDGAFGQYCIVMPEQDAVLAITSGVGDMGAVLNAAWAHLLPAMKSGELPAADAAPLKAKLASQGVPPPEGKPTTPTAQRISGKIWRFDENPDKVRSATLTFDGLRATLTLDIDGKPVSIPIGADEWIKGRDPAGDSIASRGAWLDDSTYSMKVCYYLTPFIRFADFTFSDTTVTIRRKVNVAFGPTEQPTWTGHLV